MESKLNLTMLTDFYELTMANGYFETGLAEDIAYFDMFFRKVPDGGGFAIMAGLEQTIDYLKNLKFTEEDIEYLRSKNMFCEEFLDYLRNFEFKCDVWAVPEGTPIFPHEPIVTVRGPVMQAQFIETMVLLTINHQSLIATKANRIVRAAKGRPVMEFGTRRAHGGDAAVFGARAAYIGGCAGTACAIADRDYGIKALGTMAHSWVQMFPDEYTAFKKYAEIYPQNCTLLVDTYNVLKSGVPAAIKVFKEMKPESMGIRIDSGDVTYLTKKARKMLDDAGLTDCKIVVSNSLDEYIIRDVILEGACIDSFGVGERMITAKSDPVFGVVYKISAVEENGIFQPRIKISENVEKITNPCLKQVYRIFDEDKKAIADLLALKDEEVDLSKKYRYISADKPWKERYYENFTAEKMLLPVIKNGKLVSKLPSLTEIRDYVSYQLEHLIWKEEQRFENPHKHYMDMSVNLYNTKMQLLHQKRGDNE